MTKSNLYLLYASINESHLLSIKFSPMAFINDQTIQQLADAINGKDKAQEWLQRQGRQELIMVLDAIKYDDERAAEWLHGNGHDEWGLFLTAIEGDPHAVQALFDGKQARLGTAAGAIIGEERSIQYLQKNNLKAWINFVEAVKKANAEE
jgi:hypothetical protein